MYQIIEYMYECIHPGVQTVGPCVYTFLSAFAMAWIADITIATFLFKRKRAVRMERWNTYTRNISNLVKAKKVAYETLVKDVSDFRRVIEELTISEFYTLKPDNRRILGHPLCSKCEKRAVCIREYLNKNIMLCDPHFQIVKKESDIVHPDTPKNILETYPKKETIQKNMF